MIALTPQGFICGWCDHKVASARGFFGRQLPSAANCYLYACSNCGAPTFIPNSYRPNEQWPATPPGAKVAHVPAMVERVYEEARRSAGAGCYAGAVLLCRKLLMHLAVQEGAATGLRFIEYVEYLSTKGYVPPNGKAWVDHIRKKGNEATHEIVTMSADDSKDLITFAEMLLRFMYEFPKRIPAPPTP